MQVVEGQLLAINQLRRICCLEAIFSQPQRGGPEEPGATPREINMSDILEPCKGGLIRAIRLRSSAPLA